ncbi:hypothetical protein FRC04_010157 [Tulasnella sp. 424]|nr:hypothetical protein FRC04_010157 [Tulasnella sp. 424]
MASVQTVPFEWVMGDRLESELSNPIYLVLRSADGKLMTLKQAEIPRQDSDTESKRKAELALEFLRKEYALLSSLKHPSIITCYGAEQTAEAFNVFLEYVPGGSIESLVVKYGAMEEGLARTFARSIVEGFAYLHSQSIVHRSIDSTNIFVDNQGNCKIAELSTAERLAPGAIYESAETVNSDRGSRIGDTPADLREGEKQQMNGKADIWSVGRVVLRIIGGQSVGQKDNKAS